MHSSAPTSAHRVLGLTSSHGVADLGEDKEHLRKTVGVTGMSPRAARHASRRRTLRKKGADAQEKYAKDEGDCRAYGV